MGDDKTFTLPENLFGRKAPIRRLQFDTRSIRIVPNLSAPHWLLLGITHYTSTQSMRLLDFFVVLRQMPALTYLNFHGRAYCSEEDLDQQFATAQLVQLPQLMDFIIRADCPGVFVIMDKVLVMPVAVKRRLRLELRAAQYCRWSRKLNLIQSLSPIVEAANGFQHIHFSGGKEEGWFRMWTGNAATTWEDAEFCFYGKWEGFARNVRRDGTPAYIFLTIAGMLGKETARRLVIDSPLPGLQTTYWWDLLERLPGIEELELYPASVTGLSLSRRIKKSPTMLPFLRRVLILPSKLDEQTPRQYEISGNHSTRRMVRLSSHSEDKVAPSGVVDTEEEIRGM